MAQEALVRTQEILWGRDTPTSLQLTQVSREVSDSGPMSCHKP